MNELELQFFAPTPRQRELQILVEIERDSQVSQKELATRVGLAPSMVNNYMKQLCDEGKVQKCGPNHKRISYHLTDGGRTTRDELLSGYLVEGLRLYQSLSEDLKRRLRRIQEDGISRVMLLGAAEACEAITRAAHEVGLEVVQTGDAVHVARTSTAVAGGPAVKATAFDGAQAVLVADSTTDDRGSVFLSGMKEHGLPVYHV
jgi:DNA-binding Lrp family transcriptional regulator